MSIVIIGSNHSNTAEFYKKINCAPSELITSVNHNVLCGHTSVQDIPDLLQLESVLKNANEVYWAHPSVDEFDSKDSYYRFLEWFKIYNLKFENVKNFHTISVDPYCWNLQLPALTDDNIVFFGGSTTRGCGVSNPDDWFCNIVAKHFNKTVVNLAQQDFGINNNDWCFDIFCNLNPLPGQIIVFHVPPLFRIRYCNEQSQLLNLQLARLPHDVDNHKSLISVYNQQYLFYRLLVQIRTMIKISRYNKLKFVFWLDNYKDPFSYSYENQMFFYEFPEFIPSLKMQDYMIDIAEDNMHPGTQSHKFISCAIIEHIEHLYNRNNQ